MADAPGHVSKKKAALDVAQRETSRFNAAALVAERNLSPDEERLTNEQLARRAGVSRTTLYRWMNADPEFAGIVGDAEGQIKASAFRVPSAHVHNRIKALDSIATKILTVIALRAERHAKAIDALPKDAVSAGAAAMREVMGSTPPPEAATGLLVAQPKISANGTVVTEWAVDIGPLKELRETFKHISEQLGQWEENVNLNHSGINRQYVIVHEDAE